VGLTKPFATTVSAHKAFCHIVYATHRTQCSSITPYALCTSVMHYFSTLSVHQNFNHCINPTTLVDMPIPFGTYHSMSLISETYATHLHRYIPLSFVKQSVYCPFIFLSSFSICQTNIIWSVADPLWYNSHWLLATVCLYMAFTLRKKQKHVCVHFKSKK
jgi:hypothetical protein